MAKDSRTILDQREKLRELRAAMRHGVPVPLFTFTRDGHRIWAHHDGERLSGEVLINDGMFRALVAQGMIEMHGERFMLLDTD